MLMKRKTALEAMLIFSILTLTVGMQTVTVVNADPFFIFHLIDPIPGTIPPAIRIISPLNNTAYPLGNITASFNVSRPQLGSRPTAIIEITYMLDDETVQAFSIWKGGSASSAAAIQRYNTSFIIPALPAGKHSLTVYANSVVYAGGESGLDIFFINSTSTTYFTVAAQPSLQPSPTPNQSIGSDYLHNPTLLAEIVSAIVVVAVASTSLFYFKRHNKRSELRE
jgi:hypothetical protein